MSYIDLLYSPVMILGQTRYSLELTNKLTLQSISKHFLILKKSRVKYKCILRHFKHFFWGSNLLETPTFCIDPFPYSKEHKIKLKPQIYNKHIVLVVVISRHFILCKDGGFDRRTSKF